MNDLLLIILDVFSTIFSVIAILIIIYDRIKDERKLAKRVQHFYENIENLIFTSYEEQFYRVKFTDKEDNSREIQEGKKIHGELYRYFQYYERSLFPENYSNEEYFRYLGLVPLEYDKSYFNPSGYSLNKNGSIYREPYKGPRSFSGVSLKKEDIETIDTFLSSLRNYWNKNYSKRIISPKLKKIEDFTRLSGYKKK